MPIFFTKYSTGPHILQLPSLNHKPSVELNPNFMDEINQSGVFVHKIISAMVNHGHKIEKLKAFNVPTPASFIGIGLSPTFTTEPGLIFSPSTVCILSNKHDFGSNGLSGQPSLPQQNNGYRDSLALYNYSNSLDAVRDHRLSKDILARRQKTEEMELRSNLSHYLGPADELYRDVSSKVIIQSLINQAKIQNNTWTKNSLLDFLNKACEDSPRLKKQLSHVYSKILRFENDRELNNYLKKKSSVTGKYAGVLDQGSHYRINEHLLMPRMNDLLGVSVSLTQHAGIETSFKIKHYLENDHVYRSIHGEDGCAAIFYSLSDKLHRSLIQLSWEQDLHPWHSEGLKNFIKQGWQAISTHNAAMLNHFLLLHKLSLHSRLRFIDQAGRYRDWREGGILSHHSSLPEFSNTLLAGLAAGRSVDEMRFLFHWRPTPTFDVALLDQFPNNQAAQKLRQLFAASRDEQEKDRIDLIEERFATMVSDTPITYKLRSGMVETGVARFVRPLMAHRITEGAYHFDFALNQVFEGLRRYSVQRKDMYLQFGAEYELGHIIKDGVFSPVGNSEVKLTFGRKLGATNADGEVTPGNTWIMRRRDERDASFSCSIALDTESGEYTFSLTIFDGKDSSIATTYKHIIQEEELALSLMEKLLDDSSDFGLKPLQAIEFLFKKNPGWSGAKEFLARKELYLQTWRHLLAEPAPAFQLSMKEYLTQRSPGLVERLLAS